MACIFCSIVSGESPAQILYRDDLVTAFRDFHPIASIHYLVICNRHIASINELEASDESLIGHMIMVARELAFLKDFAEKGYRIIINTGAQGGQSVYHLHLHLISGKLARFNMG